MTSLSTDSLIAALQSPDAYPHPVDDVRLLETHISWVLLAGDYAYKLKKPVRLDFLDFSTLERRRHFCHEELRLNRRLAPDLYLDVVPIAGSPTDPRFGGDGPPLEYGVRMRRFPQERLLSTMIAAGMLRPEHIDLLAAEAAAFHAALPPALDEAPWGTPEIVEREARDNFDALDRSVRNPRLRSELEQLRRWTEEEFERRWTDFAARRRNGAVRECHGDMHLGNMVLQDGRVVIFDGIEFSEELRWIDVLSEAAFVVMDLEDRGRPDYARRFLNAYLERTGDYGGLPVLPFYLVYRALVRAKVAAIRAAQRSGDNEQPSSDADTAGYIDLAVKMTRSRQPRLWITHGPSGSGKTTGSGRAVEVWGAVRVRSDVERKRLLQAPLRTGSSASADPELYSAAATERTYARLADCAAGIVRAGFPAIVDATFLRTSDRRRFHKLAADLNVPFGILDFTADPACLRERVRARAAAAQDASDADEHVLERQLQTSEPLSPEERAWVVDGATASQCDVAQAEGLSAAECAIHSTRR